MELAYNGGARRICTRRTSIPASAESIVGFWLRMGLNEFQDIFMHVSVLLIGQTDVPSGVFEKVSGVHTWLKTQFVQTSYRISGFCQNLTLYIVRFSGGELNG